MGSNAPPLRLDSLMDPTRQLSGPLAVGLLHNTLLPSLSLHSSLSLVAYTIGRLTHRVEAKDWLWPSGLVFNAWYHAVLSPSFTHSLPLRRCLADLGYTQKLLLAGVTLWGSRCFYRVASRSLRRGKDDPRYEDVSVRGWWNMAYFTVFLPEAVVQSLVALAWSLPFEAGPSGAGGAVAADLGAGSGLAGTLHGLALGLFSAGLGLEVLADAQLARQRRDGEELLVKDGVWSLVRHPNYLGDALVHFSFPLLLYSSRMFSPLTLVGPFANLAFLRLVGGDAQTEKYQEQKYRALYPAKYAQLEEWRARKNSFWPSVAEVANPWTWAVVAIGSAGAVLEWGVRRYVVA